MLKDSIATLAAIKPPPLKERMQAIADVHASISALESRLGLRHSTLTLNPQRAISRLNYLQAMFTLGPAAPRQTTPAAAAVTAAPLAAAIPAAAAPAGLIGLDDFQRLGAADRAQAARDGRALPKSAFDGLSAGSKRDWCVAGGQIWDDFPEDRRCTLAKSFSKQALD